MSKRIIGFTGSLGSGCTSSAQHLRDNEEYEYISISSDVLKPLAEKVAAPFNTREEKQNFGNIVREGELRKEYLDTLLSAVNEKGGKVVIECFRNPIEIDVLRDNFPHFYLIALFATKEERSTRHSEDKFDELDKRDAGEDEDKLGQQVRKCVNNADILLNNTESWKVVEIATNYFDKLKEFVRILEEPFRKPSSKEVIMHLAYSVSLLSTCIQRQVGAVITDENYRVLSTGINDVPHSSESCLTLHSECYRKKRKEDYLPNISFCPFCSEELTAQLELLEENDDYLSDLKCNKCGKEIFELISPSKELDYCRSLHAEENAILSNPYTSNSYNSNDKNMIMFTTTFPCMLCAKKIASAGIKQIVFVEPYPITESRDILRDNGVKIEAFEGIKSLKFNWIFRKRAKYIKDFAFRRRKELKVIKGG